MSKLLENIYRATNIALVNEMKIISDRFNTDIHEVIEAASTQILVLLSLIQDQDTVDTAYL